jgi:hypothetical protein
MVEKRELEASVRTIINRNRNEALAADGLKGLAKDELSALVDVRIDQLGKLFFVRKGAPVDPKFITPLDRVDVEDIRDAGREGKRKRFLQLKNDPGYHGPLVLAEGDSWFEYPFAKDLINYAGEEYAVLSLARAGDTWSNVLDEDSDPEKKYSDGTPMGLMHTLRLPDAKPFQFVLLSVGGNDLIGQIANCVYDYDPNRPLDKYINHGGIGGFDAVMGLVASDYRSKTSDIVALGKSVILHTYDYPNPMENGQYIGYPLAHFRKIPGVGLMRRIVNQMIDLFHDELAKIAAASNGKVHLVDLRRTIGTDDYLNGPDPNFWKDEMHGNNQGFGLLWQRMDKDLKKIFAQPGIA